MAALFKTRLTELFGIEHPILGGGLMWLSDANYVAALVNAGCMGFITPRSFADIATFRAQMRRCAELTDGKPFGVNLTLSGRDHANSLVPQWMDAALAEGVRHFETAGQAPGDVIGAIHREGGIVIHKAPSLRHAASAARAGADAVAVVGMEEGGHPGANELPTFLMGALAASRMEVPVVVGGGIGSGAQIVAALALGAEGVLMGSRFLVAGEIGTHLAYKQRLVESDEHSTVRVLHTLGNTWRVLRNDTSQQVAEIERAGATDYAAFGQLLNSRTARERCYDEGNVSQGMLSLGPAIAFADRIEPMAMIVERLLLEAQEGIGRLGRIVMPSTATRAISGADRTIGSEDSSPTRKVTS